MAVMSMKQVLHAINDQTLIKIYQGKTLVSKGNWYQDHILKYADKELVEADLDGTTNICTVRVIRKGKESK